MILYCCILKGKTTTESQFKRFVESFTTAWNYARNYVDLRPYFFVDSDEAESLLLDNFGDDVEILRRNDDPGELRNEFLARLQMISGDECNWSQGFFTFFDGDDEISPNYFFQNYGLISGRGFAIGNPVAVYGEEETDRYPLKWCLTAGNMDIVKATFLDKKGCQSWGNIYELEVCKHAMFGRGLFEDVTFMYSVVSRYRNPVLFNDMVYYWHRDNQIALTRTSATVSQIKDGMDNLDNAKEIALKAGFGFESPEVYRRYTIGTLVLVRNSAKLKDKENSLNYILKRLDWRAFKYEDILEAEPKFKEKLIGEFPNFYKWIEGVNASTSVGESNEQTRNSTRRPRKAGRKSNT